MLALLALGACSDVDRATSDGEGQIEQYLIGLEEDKARAWTSRDAATELVAPPVERVGAGFRRYEITSTDEDPDLRYVFRAEGSSKLFLAEETVQVGACVSVRGPAGEVPTIEQIACPASEVERLGEPIEVQPEIVGEARPVRCPDDLEVEGCG